MTSDDVAKLIAKCGQPQECSICALYGLRDSWHGPNRLRRACPEGAAAVECGNALLRAYQEGIASTTYSIRPAVFPADVIKDKA